MTLSLACEWGFLEFIGILDFPTNLGWRKFSQRYPWSENEKFVSKKGRNSEYYNQNLNQEAIIARSTILRNESTRTPISRIHKKNPINPSNLKKRFLWFVSVEIAFNWHFLTQQWVSPITFKSIFHLLIIISAFCNFNFQFKHIIKKFWTLTVFYIF